jgi:ABC-type branched-subunit amino acid transport system ATPase component
MLDVNGLSAGYGQVKVLHDVSINVWRGRSSRSSDRMGRGYVMDRGSIVLEGPSDVLAQSSAMEDVFLGASGTGR